ncbi:lipopolysaccharide biosynthesis protein [Novosphingobium guangzhouense]|uniref:Lipopolysaccharide biosynthesis protein n=1 Tax=Novosphingobium guangzhouense TaxID=1850347 RepID=A0A2K2FWJ7_9SPHN|nr:lipopolysaccharide biosynthesis protein [Novosphingobium guangzhouense]PNU03169.1 hypothetical protein A8V01_24515 [Novosphingobium guangzhouense]
MTSHRPGIASPLLWSTASSLGTQALGFVTFAVLARLLGAPAFGLVALAALVIDLLLLISNAGISEAVIQRNSLSDEDADTAFWANLACGAMFCACTIIAAPLIARLFGQPELRPILIALASIFGITPLGAIHTARLSRELRFRSVAMRNCAAAMTGAMIGLPLALAGYGVWALVGQRIGASIAMVISVWLSTRWTPQLRFRWATCRDMVRFGAHLGIAGTLNQINIRSAEIISGMLVGPIAVAFIRAGSRIVEVLNQITYTPFQQISMPIMARTAHDHHMLKATYLRLSRMSAFIMFPAFFGTLALARPIVAIVFGPGWAPVADAIRIFACAVVASQINNLIVAAITSTGSSRTVLKWTSTQIILGLTAAVAVHRLGWQAMLITGVARGYIVLPYSFALLRKHVGIRFREVLGSIWPALSSSAVMVLVVTIGMAMGTGQLAPPYAIAFWLPAGAATYFAFYIWQDRTILQQMHEVLRMRMRKMTPS